jgi:protein-S-isoprenylcysteine O-methyltransferase Ste14
VLLLQVISLALVIAAPYRDRRNIAVIGEAEIIRYVGLVLFVLGFVGMNRAEATRGKQFSIQVTIQDSHQLVTNGPYRYLRHPRYLGIIIFNIGISLVFRSWLALILVVALLLVLIWRIHDEEALMHQEFGANWEAYCQRSWCFIPYLY